ncbi:hypothetical protein PENTCL1PPCAC_22014, partial [Pristionchus entomophagus]
ALSILHTLSSVLSAITCAVYREKKSKQHFPRMLLLKRDWTRNHVYLFTYPRCRRIPNISPWSLKMETWLRLARIPYTAIATFSKGKSIKSSLPFVEVNGRQMADSAIIIETLKVEFGKSLDHSLSSDEVSRCRAITALVEEQMTPCLMVLLLPDVEYLVSDEAWGPHLGRGLTGWFRRRRMERRMRRQIASSVDIRGAGRHSYAELTDLIKEALDALSTLLGDRPYFTGASSSTIDATVFGHVACLVYAPTPDGVLTDYVRITRPTIGKFIERMKETFWPDWEEACRTRNMNTHRNP